MAQLYEQLSIEQIKELLPDFSNQLLDMAAATDAPRFITPDDEDVGIQLLRVVHRSLRVADA